MVATVESLVPNDRINFSTVTNIQGRTLWSDVVFVGYVGFDIAKNMGDVPAIVAATAPFFPPGSSTRPEAINYVLVKSAVVSGIVVIPYPALDKSSLEMVTNQVHSVTIRDAVTAEKVRQILSGNGLTDFTISTQNGGS